MADRTIKVRLVGDIGDYQAKMRAAGKSTGDLGSASTASAANLAAMAAKATVVAGTVLAAGKAVFAFAQDASRLEQAVGATTSVFGDASGRIDEFAETSVDAFGLSERAFRELASVAGAQLKSLGFSVDEAAQTSNQLITIGADLAATFGGTTEDAVRALGAAFRGEADPAEALGLRLNQMAVNAKAVEMGLAETTGAVDANAKAQATLALIVEQSADSMGQAGREASSMAGAQQRAAAQWENTRATLGRLVTGPLTDVTEQFTAVTEILTDPSWAGFEEVLKGPIRSVDALTLGVFNFDAALQGSAGATDAQKQAAIEAAGAADEWTVVNGEAVRVNREAAGQARATAEAQERQAETLGRVAEAIDDVTAATFSAIDHDFAYRRSLVATEEAAVALRDGEGDLADELLDTEGAVLDQAEAARALAEDNAHLAGVTDATAIGTAAYRQTLVDLMAQIPELAPIIQAHIDKLDAVPENVQSAMSAQADLGSVDRAVSEMQNRLTALGVPVIINPGSRSVARAHGGVDAHIARRPSVLYGERQTGMEAFIPQRGISRARATGILGEAANWYGYGLAELAEGGFVWPISMSSDYLKNMAPALSAGIGWKAMWAALQASGLGAQLFSAFRPGAVTATGNQSYHALGRAIDVTPSMGIFNWIKGNYGGSKEIIYSPAGGAQVRNGHDHFYGEPTRGDHWGHAHWAMREGGVTARRTPIERPAGDRAVVNVAVGGQQFERLVIDLLRREGRSRS